MVLERKGGKGLCVGDRAKRIRKGNSIMSFQAFQLVNNTPNIQNFVSFEEFGARSVTGGGKKGGKRTNSNSAWVARS